MSLHRLVRRVSSKLQRTPVRVAARVPSLPRRMLLLFPPGWLVSTISCQLLVPQVGLPCKVSTCVNHVLVHSSTSYHITSVPCCTFVRNLCVVIQSTQPGGRCLPTLAQRAVLSQQFQTKSSLSHSSSPRYADQQHTEPQYAMGKFRSWSGCWRQLLQGTVVPQGMGSCSNHRSQHSKQSNPSKL